MKNDKLTYKHEAKQVHFNPQHRTDINDKDRDLALWTSFKNGESQAFAKIYDTFFPILYNYGLQFTQDKEIIKDVIQDLFIDINERKSRLGEVKNIKFYLFKGLKRRLIALLDKRHLPNFPNLLKVLPSFAISTTREQEIILEETEKNKYIALEKAYEQLSERQREVLIYYFYEGLTYEEISELMGFSKVEHARKLVYRSILKLRSIFEKKGFIFFSITLIIIIYLFIR